MNANNDVRMSGAVDQKAFEKVIRENLSPDGVATIVAFLQPEAFHKPANQNALNAAASANDAGLAGVSAYRPSSSIKRLTSSTPNISVSVSANHSAWAPRA